MNKLTKILLERAKEIEKLLLEQPVTDSNIREYMQLISELEKIIKVLRDKQ